MLSKEMNVKCFPVQPPITYYGYQFCFHDACFTLSIMFQLGVFPSLLMKSVHMDTHVPHLVSIKMCLSIYDMCGGEYNVPRKVDIVILVNDQLDALFFSMYLFQRLYMFRAASAHHQEGQLVLIHHLV